jgi:predicted transcriptional regulator
MLLIVSIKQRKDYGGKKMSRHRSRRRLGDAELEIMQVIWHSDRPLTSSDISKGMERERKWALSTLMTSLARLERKGFVNCDRSTRSNLYTSSIGEEDYRTAEGKDLLVKLFNNSVEEMIISMNELNLIPRDQFGKLRTYIDSIRKEG